MLTIKTKIILAYTLVFGLMLLGFAYFIYADTHEAETDKLDARLESYAAHLSQELSEESDEPRTFEEQAKILLLEAERMPGLRVRIAAPGGAVAAGDTLFAAHPPDLRPDKEFPDGRIGILTDRGTRFRYLHLTVEDSDADHPSLDLALPETDLEEHLRRLLIEFVIGIPLALLVTSLAAYGITLLAFRPMIGMVDTAEQITASNLHTRLTLPRAHDEVRRLGEALNGMIGRIEASFRSQKQFIADASHEIRTPLTVLCSELEFAVTRTTEAPVKESIQTSLLEIDRMTKLTDSLLYLAKLDASQLKLELRPVRLDEMLVECVQRIGAVAARKKIQIKIDLQDAVEMRADGEKLKRAVLNLLDNAVKYAPEGTIVTASLASGPSGGALIRIDDEGPGIAPSALPDIFTRFYRADPARSDQSGAGLGLAIVRQLVELHGGTVRVTSEPGNGSSFVIDLPEP